MQDKLVTFSLAKLAKEKGFKEQCFYSYDKKGNIIEPYLENGSSTDTDFRVDLTDLLENYNAPYSGIISAPTQSQLQTWLREKHKIFVTALPFKVKEDDISLCWYYSLVIYNEEDDILCNEFDLGASDDCYDTYYEALETGELEALISIEL